MSPGVPGRDGAEQFDRRIRVIDLYLTVLNLFSKRAENPVTTGLKLFACKDSVYQLVTHKNAYLYCFWTKKCQAKIIKTI